MFYSLRNSYRKLKYKYSDELIHSDSIKLFWWNERANIGDALNHQLVKNVSGGKEIVWVPNNYGGEFFTAVGSVLQLANKNTTVWGSGLISNKARPIFEPNKLLAVRGPLTKKVLDKLGYQCPAVFGDPALLLPKYFSPMVKRRFKLGIVPHFVDRGLPFFQQEFPDWLKVINIETDDVSAFVSDICSCDMIVSSSLHGIIIADAYGIPSARVAFSSLIAGGDFKFYDYALSVGRQNYKAHFVSADLQCTKLLKLNYELASSINTDSLLDVNPFQ